MIMLRMEVRLVYLTHSKFIVKIPLRVKFIVSKIVGNKVREQFPSVLFGNVELL